MVFTVDENGWLLIAEAPDEKTMSAAMIVVMAGGGITDIKTTAVLTSKQLMEASARAEQVLQERGVTVVLGSG